MEQYNVHGLFEICHRDVVEEDGDSFSNKTTFRVTPYYTDEESELKLDCGDLCLWMEDQRGNETVADSGVYISREIAEKLRDYLIYLYPLDPPRK